MRRWLVPVRGDRVDEILEELERRDASEDLHVVILSVQPKPVGWQTRGLYREEIEAHLMERGRRACQPVASRLAERAISHEVIVRLGDETTEILRCAESMACDEIILRADQPSWLKRLLLRLADRMSGSTTAEVARSSAVPVVVVH